MAVVDEIAVKLGLSTAEFNAVLKDVNVSIEDFKKKGTHGEDEGFSGTIKGIHHQMRLLHQFILGGGIIEVFKQLFEKGAEYAEKHKDAIDEDIQAMLQLKEASKDLGEGVSFAFTKIAGIMHDVGAGLAGLVFGTEALQEAIKREAAEMQAALAIEDQKKAAEIAKIRRDIAYETADQLGKAKILMQEVAELEVKEAALKAGSLEAVKVQAQIEKDNFEASKLI